MPTEYITNPLSIIDSIGASTKALLKSRKVPFNDYNAGSGGIQYLGPNGWGGGSLGHYGYGNGSPGAAHDYVGLAGDLLQCSTVAAVIAAKSSALADAPAILEQRDGDTWERVSEHPILKLLSTPNPYHGSADIWGVTCAAEDTTGQAFWRLEFDRSGTPAEIWAEHSDRFRIVGRGGQYISHYVYTPLNGAPIELEDREVIHFRRALNVHNGRLGWTPLSAGMRQVAGDNGAATYHSAILRNSGVMSLLISIKEGVTTGNGLSQPQMQEFVDAMKRKFFGEGAGGIAGLNLPLDVKNMSYSPDEMALDKLISYYEARICALMGVDPMVVGLGSGTTTKTYANFSEALNDFWERCIVPTKNRHAATLNAQLLPLFDLDPAEYRIGWDYGNVAPLQENEQEKHQMLREDYKAGAFDLFTYQTRLGVEPGEELRGVWYQKPKQPEGKAEAMPSGTAIGDTKSMNSEIKAGGWESQPRDERGRWAHSAAFHDAAHSAVAVAFHAPRKEQAGKIDAAVNAIQSAKQSLPDSHPAHEHYDGAIEHLNYSKIVQGSARDTSIDRAKKRLWNAEREIEQMPHQAHAQVAEAIEAAFYAPRKQQAEKIDTAIEHIENARATVGSSHPAHEQYTAAIETLQYSKTVQGSARDSSIDRAKKRIWSAGQEIDKSGKKSIDNEIKATDTEREWSDAELDEFTQDDVKFALGSSTPEMRDLLRAQGNDKDGE